MWFMVAVVVPVRFSAVLRAPGAPEAAGTDPVVQLHKTAPRILAVAVAA